MYVLVNVYLHMNKIVNLNSNPHFLERWRMRSSFCVMRSRSSYCMVRTIAFCLMLIFNYV